MSTIQPCPGCAATNQVQAERIAALEAQLAAERENITKLTSLVEYHESGQEGMRQDIGNLRQANAQLVAERDAVVSRINDAKAKHVFELLADEEITVMKAKEWIVEYASTGVQGPLPK